MLRLLSGLGLLGNCPRNVRKRFLVCDEVNGDLQQTAEKLHTVADCAGEENHYANACEARVSPEGVWDQCWTVVLYLIVHPPDESRDCGCTDAQQRNVRCMPNAVDVG